MNFEIRLVEKFSSTTFPKNYDIVKLRMARKENIYRVKIGDFRLLYLISDTKKNNFGNKTSKNCL